MKDNKLIAEFMGLQFSKGEYYRPLFNSGDWISEDELHYHTSWDWLMPVVVECFERLGNTDTIDYMRLNDALLTCNIDELYNAVVEFIEEHNVQLEKDIKNGLYGEQ
jgi:hypothetical protein